MQPLQNRSENAQLRAWENSQTRSSAFSENPEEHKGAQEKNKTPFVSAEKMWILSATTAKPQRECKDPSVLLWIRSENAVFFSIETIEKQKL